MNATDIAHCLARNLFRSDLVVVDRCTWPGSECDLLVVTPRLQVIDVEIKISRADLKADRLKEKWYEYLDWEQRDALQRQLGRRLERGEARTPREWPRNVWKHYYAMPAQLWKPELAEFCHPTSGIITVDVALPGASVKHRAAAAARSPANWLHHIVRRAKPCRTYTPIGDKALRKIAFLASCRMWDAYWGLAQFRRDLKQVATTAAGSAA